MKRIIICVLALLLAVLTVGCKDLSYIEHTDKNGGQTDPTVEPSNEDNDATEAPINETEEPIMTNNPVATITMQDGGEIVLELYPNIAPETVANFISLANSGFYDGLIFHRVISGFMIQGGCPDGAGTGGPGYSIKGEFSANGIQNNLSHTRGVISMARAQPVDSAGSQFFIVHADSDFLDGQYAAFGMVTSGMDVVDRIAATPTNNSDRPLSDQVISSITVDTFGVDYGEPTKLN